MHAPMHESRKITLRGYETGEEHVNIPWVGNGYAYEIKAVHDALAKGLNEHPDLPLRHSLELIQTLDIIRRKTGLEYPADKA
jgi:hypothetical protein